MPFKAILGQTQAVRWLQAAVAQERLAHTLLFSGPDGVGKRATALALAQALNCAHPQAGDACGECVSCLKIAGNTHPDVLVIAPDGDHLKIDQIRETLQYAVVLKPLEARTKVYILDEAQSLTLEAANSLLKLLEEPPANVVLVLITSQPQGLLPTIRSRCQEVRFAALGQAVLVPWLQARLGVSQPEAETLARTSAGRPAEALRLAEPERRALRDRAWTLLASLPQVGWSQAAAEWQEDADTLAIVLEVWLQLLRDRLALAQGAAVRSLLNPDRGEALRAFGAADPDTLRRQCQAVLHGLDQLQANVNPQLLLEGLLIQLGAGAPAALLG